MNKIQLNTITDGGVIIKGGGGGGVTINNQEKSVDITENGTTEVVADAGFTGLGKVTINTNVPTGGGGTELEGEYFLAKPNGRYWKFTFMPEGHRLRIEDFETSQIDTMCQVYNLLLQMQCVYGAAVSTDDASLRDELAKLDGLYNIGSKMEKTYSAIQLYQGGYDYNKQYFNQGFLRVWKECDVKSNPPVELELGGIAIPPSSNLVELVKKMARMQGMEATDDEAISLLEQAFMITPATEEEYKYWRHEE